jgi:excisionase family DNA binding protein
MANTEETLLCDRLQAATLLATSVDTIDGLIAQGALRTVRFGRSLRIPRRDLEELVERMLTNSEPTPERGGTDDHQ